MLFRRGDSVEEREIFLKGMTREGGGFRGSGERDIWRGFVGATGASRRILS